ncbi:hypothetical protein Q867_11265 [Listeria monocytogenes]|uniref:phage tail protein n=1 Tax=Listeria monocytogenes TaxID=1639 RepID=UPI0010EDF3C3|nr:phage tail protein [Listeria monocytogenes]EAE0012280.1 hypothetical protein [Listeria monocytogenes]
MDIFVSDYEKQYKEILTGFDPTSFSETWVENQQWQLDFYVEKTRNNQDVFDLLNHESSVYLDGQEFVVKQLKRGAVGKIVYSEVTATHIYFTMQDDYQYNTVSGSKSAKDCLTHIFSADKQGFSFELIDKNKVLENITQENFGNGNLLKLVQEVLEDYKLVMLADNKRLTFIPSEDYGEHTENEIRYNKHTNEVDFDIDTLSLKTQIRGYGKVDSNGNNYFPPVTYTSPESSKWGVRIQEPLSDERYTTSSSMLRRLKLELQDYPATTGNISLKLKYECGKGDYVMFVYEPLGLLYEVQIVAYKKYIFTNKPPELTLSNNKKTMVSIMVQLAKAIKKGAK